MNVTIGGVSLSTEHLDVTITRAELEGIEVSSLDISRLDMSSTVTGKVDVDVLARVLRRRAYAVFDADTMFKLHDLPPRSYLSFSVGGAVKEWVIWRRDYKRNKVWLEEPELLKAT